MMKKILTVRNFLLSFSLLLLLSPTIVYATELEGGTVYEEIQEESIEEVENSESEVVNEETQSEEPTQEETTKETQSVVIYETPTSESIDETENAENIPEETEMSEPTEENTQPIQINIQTDNAEIIENTDEEGNIIGYTVNSNDIVSETSETDLTGIETSLENMNEQLREVTLILYVIAMLLGGFLIYVLVHWALNKKGVLE